LTFSEELGIDLSQMEQPEPGLYVLDVEVGVGAAARLVFEVQLMNVG